MDAKIKDGFRRHDEAFDLNINPSDGTILRRQVVGMCPR